MVGVIIWVIWLSGYVGFFSFGVLGSCLEDKEGYCLVAFPYCGGTHNGVKGFCGNLRPLLEFMECIIVIMFCDDNGDDDFKSSCLMFMISKLLCYL